MKRNTSARPAPFNFEADDGAVYPGGSRRRISAASGCAGIGRKIHALDGAVRRQPRSHPAGVGALALHAQRQRLDAAHGQIAFERARAPDRRRAPGSAIRHSAPHPSPRCRPSRRRGRPGTWWRYVRRNARQVRAAARSTGVANVLSTISAAPAARAISAMRSSGATRSSGFEMVSTSTQPGLIPPRLYETRPGRKRQRNGRSRRTGSITFISRLTVAP